MMRVRPAAGPRGGRALGRVRFRGAAAGGAFGTAAGAAVNLRRLLALANACFAAVGEGNRQSLQREHDECEDAEHLHYCHPRREEGQEVYDPDGVPRTAVLLLARVQHAAGCRSHFPLWNRGKQSASALGSRR